VDLAVTMNPAVLEDKLEDAQDGRRVLAVWNTKRLPKKLTPGWTNRLFVAAAGRWRGFFPLSGDLLWNPDDETAPYGLVFNARVFRRLPPVPVAGFRGWKYLEDGEFPLPPPQKTDAPSPSS